MNLLDYNESELRRRNAYLTAEEIKKQPQVWAEVIELITEKEAEITDFVKKLPFGKDLKIIFTGAGSSAYVGEAVASFLDSKLKADVTAVPTTDIVTHPQNYFNSKHPFLLVSCARSGNSPESTAAVDLAEKLTADLYQLVITCNSNGDLAKRVEERPENLKLILPESTHDQGFAMTGSFTGMVLSSLEVFKAASDFEMDFQLIIKTGEYILNNLVTELKGAIDQKVNRVVFLGSAPLKGLIKESALKVLELSGGRIVTDAYTFLGFRHGPKSQVNDQTLIVSYLSTEEYARQYELDLIKELALDKGEHTLITISKQLVVQAEEYSDYYWQLDLKEKDFPADNYLLFNYILFAQLIAFFKSMSLGLSPDDPSPGGEVNRVVKGVKIYPYLEGN